MPVEAKSIQRVQNTFGLLKSSFLFLLFLHTDYINTCLLWINDSVVTSWSFRDPVHAGGGSGPGRPEHRPRRAALQSDGADAQDPLQSDVLHQLHHRRGFSHWRRSVPTEDSISVSHLLAFSWCLAPFSSFNSISSQQTCFTFSENQLSHFVYNW